MAYVPKDETSVGINYFEYNVEKKSDGKAKLIRVALFVIDAILVAITLATVPMLLWPIGMGLAILTFFLYKRTQVEFEYEINSGELTMAKIYGGRSRKTLFSQKLSSFQLLSPYTPDRFNEATKGADIKVYNCISSPDAMDIYFGLFTDENGIKSAVILQAPKKAVSVFRFYNSSATLLK